MFRYNKVINEYEFPPLEVLHYLLITLRLGRHFKGEFRLTKRGRKLAQTPGKLFAELVPFFILQIDHASYARFEDRPFGRWDVWMNVINVEADHGTTEGALFAAFYGQEHDWDNAECRESLHHLSEDAHVAPTLPAVVEGLHRAVFFRSIAPPQPIAIGEYYATQNAPVIHARLAMDLRKERLKLHHLIFAQPVKIAHRTPPCSGD
jgi:hypothetical protein